MVVILAIILMRLFSFTAADPPSPHDYVLCSQVFIMHQYCMSKLISTSAAPNNHPRPRGGPGVLNKTEINEEIVGRFSDLKDEIERKFTTWSREADSKMERMRSEIASGKIEWQELKDQLDEMKGSLDSEMNKTFSFIANGTKDLEEKIESKFTSWRMEAESDMRTVKAWIEERNNSFSAALTSTAPHVLSTKDLTTSPTTETTTKVSCDITFNGICYWTHVEDELNVNFARAEEICSSKSSTPAHFPSERVYNAVFEDLRLKIPSGRSYVTTWTGVTFNTNTGNVIHPSGDTYVKWIPGYPWSGSAWETYAHVVLLVNSDPGSTDQGMGSVLPQWSYYGVVCQNVE